MQGSFASYVVGGIAAELSGDKFKNGEISVAFNRMFNDLAQVHKVMNTPKIHIMDGLLRLVLSLQELVVH
ncbi:hypothetical protein THERMOT_1717 [Bathymodiolus thermophilus thioautotrophic gill symbiont]|uniref:hypothetical protein n=1 Tax=Bathymodiolus thermophilus thioautotrophic gill symbiont TaxID=2360 RepID=UPI00192AC7A7|nr:hypothetical protein [Bathymodiolus thermophilus thioautotrophic gill symbiont]CAB5502988.1 hypothetical protein THERMOT_1717 [Bathymodiolus thermophilus thioautotrophic gill symbiont]